MRAGVLLLLAAAIGCGEANELGGSMGSSFSLAFGRVRVRRQEQHLLVEYLNDISSGTETVCKLVVDTEGLELFDGSEIDGARFLRAVWIQRVAHTGGDFPPPNQGSVSLERFRFKAGGRVAGEFEAVFRLGRPENEQTRDLWGRFDGTVQVVSTD